MTRRILLASLFSSLVACTALVRADDAPASGGIIAATDHDQIKANVDKEIVIAGKIDKAEWSRSGKVFNITFEGVEESKFAVVYFERNKAKFDEALLGDAGKTLTGAEVRIRGKVSAYKGKSEKLKERLEVQLTEPSQITITTPSTKPAM
jgi:DNA/RNA endonuclease YhcR with UshA esterase domain